MESNKISFKAGQMKMNQDTKKVQADHRQGQVDIFKDQDGNTHLTWTDTQSKQEEVHLYLFPGDAKTEASKQVKKTILIRVESDIYFFWLQENLMEDELAFKINKLVEQVDDEMEDEEYQYDDDESNQQQPQVQQFQQQQGGDMLSNEFQRALQQLQNIGPINQQQQQYVHESPYLTDIFDSKIFEFIVNDEECCHSLLEHLPEGQQSKEFLLENLRSAQFQQSLEGLDRAINSGDILTLLISIGLDKEALKGVKDGNEALYKALLMWAKKNQK